MCLFDRQGSKGKEKIGTTTQSWEIPKDKNLQDVLVFFFFMQMMDDSKNDENKSANMFNHLYTNIFHHLKLMSGYVKVTVSRVS